MLEFFSLSETEINNTAMVYSTQTWEPTCTAQRNSVFCLRERHSRAEPDLPSLPEFWKLDTSTLPSLKNAQFYFFTHFFSHTTR